MSGSRCYNSISWHVRILFVFYDSVMGFLRYLHVQCTLFYMSDTVEHTAEILKLIRELVHSVSKKSSFTVPCDKYRPFISLDLMVGSNLYC